MYYRRLGETGLQVSPLCLGTWRFGKESDGVVETDRESAHELLDDLVSAGTVHYVGVSTCDAWRLTKGLWKADVENYETYTVTQPLFHAAYYEDVAEYLAVCADQNLAICPYSPLAGGFLTGKYERVGDGTYDLDAPDGTRAHLDDRFETYYVSERGWHVLDEVRAVAEEVDATPAQVALRWLIDQPDFDCVPIIGTRTVDQLDENLGAIDVSLRFDLASLITGPSFRARCPFQLLDQLFTYVCLSV